MQFGTYVASGYKYGLLCCPDDNLPALKKAISESIGEDNQNKSTKKDVELDTNVLLESVVPFEMVDGLSLEELKDYARLLSHNRYLVFIMYDSLPIAEKNGNSNYKVYFEPPEEQGRVRCLYAIDTEKNGEFTIDDVLGDHLISVLDQLNVQNRRRALCFLEKYIVKSKMGVNNVISNYLDRKAKQEGSWKPYITEYIKLPKRLTID